MRFTHIVQFVTSFGKPIEDEQQLRHLADRAYARLTEWFGNPHDETWPYRLMSAPFSGISRDPRKCEYIIFLPATYRYVEQRVASICHEMYHRVTVGMLGLHQQLWVDEMLAFMASQRLLRELGYGLYAKHRFGANYNPRNALSVSSLYRARRRRVLFGLGGFAYPPGFTAGIVMLSTRFEALLDWHDICQIVHFQDWFQWLQTVPSDVRPELRRLLQLDTESS